MHPIIIFCAQYLIFITLAVAGLIWLTLPKKQKLEVVIFWLITAVIAFALAKISGRFFYDARPFITDHVTPLLPHANDNGFPSDHTLLASVVAVTIYSVSKKWGAVLGVFAVIIGASRVLAYVHHPIDILGSMIMALLGGVVAYYVTPKITGRVLNKEPKVS